jgi:hypothetical protein
MITQTIKHWLSTLFAWWPWKRTATAAYAPTNRLGTMGMPQERLSLTSGEGSLTQTARSVVVEQSDDNAMPEATLPLRPLSVEHIDTVTPSPTLREVSSPSRLPQDEQTRENLIVSDTQFGSETTPAFEQQLAFLSYLVSHGLVNEGFEEGEVPEQYRKKQV